MALVSHVHSVLCGAGGSIGTHRDIGHSSQSHMWPLIPFCSAFLLLFTCDLCISFTKLTPSLPMRCFPSYFTTVRALAGKLQRGYPWWLRGSTTLVTLSRRCSACARYSGSPDWPVFSRDPQAGSDGEAAKGHGNHSGTSSCHSVSFSPWSPPTNRASSLHCVCCLRLGISAG